MPAYEPKHFIFRAVLWRGDPGELYQDWLDKGLVSVQDDGTLICNKTLHGPVPIPPDGNFHVREHAAHVKVDEVWPVRVDIFEAQFQAVTE